MSHSRCCSCLSVTTYAKMRVSAYTHVNTTDYLCFRTQYIRIKGQTQSVFVHSSLKFRKRRAVRMRRPAGETEAPRRTNHSCLSQTKVLFLTFKTMSPQWSYENKNNNKKKSVTRLWVRVLQNSGSPEPEESPDRTAGVGGRRAEGDRSFQRNFFCRISRVES